jgi:superfamily II DNA or RNA helicase
MGKLDEQALSDAAGWKAMKEGRALLAAGKVESASREGERVVGVLNEGSRRRRVSLTINGPSHIDTRCGCPTNASSGALCGHAVAVLLATLGGQPSPVAASLARQTGTGVSPTRPAPSGTVRLAPAAVSLHFPPDFAGHLARGTFNVGLRGVPGAPVEPADVLLAQWLGERGVERIPPAVQVAAGEVAGFLGAIAGHPRAFAGADKPLELVAEPGRLVVECVEDGPRLGFRRDPGAGALLIESPAGQWLWDAQQRRLAPLAPDAPLPVGFWRDLGAGKLAWIDRSMALGHHAWLQDAFSTPADSWIERLQFRPADFTPALHLEGTLNGLAGRLGFDYAENGKSIATHDFPVISNDQSDLCLTRDLAGEEFAERRLGAAGFEPPVGAGEWRLAGEEAVLDFLGDALPRLRRDWKVIEGPRLATVLRQTEMVRPRLRFEGSGEDWLALDFDFVSDGGSPIGKDQIRRMLRTGQRRFRLPSGRQAVIAADAAEMLEAVLFEVNPRQEGGKFIIPAEQESYLRELDRSLRAADEVREVRPFPVLSSEDEGLLGELGAVLRPYQRAGIGWLRARIAELGCALLADDMGLGKTLQALAWLRLHRFDHSGPALIVCPTSLLGNWEAEAAKFTAEARVLVMHGQGRQRHHGQFADFDVILTTYGSLVRDLDLYANTKLAAIVLDEASVIRNPDAEISKAVTRVQAGARLALTGTPIENGVRDLWAVFRFLKPGYLGSRNDFRDRYEAAVGKGAADPGVMRRLRMRTAAFLLRRTKGEVAKDLPSKVECIEWCALTGAQQKVYGSLLKEGQEVVAAARKSGGVGAARMKTLTTLLRLRQTCCDLALIEPKLASEGPAERSGKLERLLEIVAEATEGGRKMLIFSQFATMLGHIRGQLERAGIDCCYLDGSTRDRAGEVARFQAPAGPPVFLISLKAGGYGLNLTAADVVVHFDPWWNPAVEAQATDRAHRIGQTKPITVYKFISRGTVEEKVLHLQQAKRQVINDALDESGTSNPSNLNDADLLELLG